jgi:methanogenic corrinoid protein MtbC1
VRGQLNPAAIAQLSTRLVETLLDPRLRPADAEGVIENAMAEGWSGAEIYLHVLPAAWNDIGARWQNGAIGIGEEHLATSVLQSALRRLAPSLPRAARHGLSVTVACIGRGARTVELGPR